MSGPDHRRGAAPPAPPGGMQRREQAREQLRRSLADDWTAKLLALLAACVLWFFASEDRRSIIEQTYDVPVTVRDNTGADAGERRAVSGLSPGTIKVTLSGRPERLRELRGDRIEAVTDVTGLPEGSFNTPVTVVAPDSTAVRRITPDRVQGLVDTVQTRTLPITVTVYAPGSALMPSYEVQPQSVTVSGPSRAVNDVQQIIYAPVRLEPGETQRVALLALNGSGEPAQDITLSPSSATLTREDTDPLPVTTLPVRLKPPPAGLSVVSATLLPTKVRVVGPAGTLSGLSEVTGTPEYRVGTYEAPVQLDLPAEAEALDRVTVRLQVQPSP